MMQSRAGFIRIPPETEVTRHNNIAEARSLTPRRRAQQRVVLTLVSHTGRNVAVSPRLAASFADAEFRENIVHDVFRRSAPRDFPECVIRLAKVDESAVDGAVK